MRISGRARRFSLSRSIFTGDVRKISFSVSFRSNMTEHTFLVLLLFSVFCQINCIQEKTSSCGKIFLEEEFEISSDNYPDPYPPDSECFYLLKGNNCTANFAIRFLDFDLKDSKGCTEERLEIGHQAALCGARNGSKSYIAEENALRLKFISDKQPGNKGFKLLIKRIDSCAENVTETEKRDRSDIDPTTESVEENPRNAVTFPQPTYLPPPPETCCENNVFSAKKIFLLSPGFPYSISKPHDCIYVIEKVNNNVCRLRIDVHFFSLGRPTQNSCSDGYIEIDGKFICGCNREVKLIANFREEKKKFIRFFNTETVTGEMTGFVLEIAQDECPKRYTPEEAPISEKVAKKFRFYNDQYNRVSWPDQSNINQLKLVNERVDRINSDKNQDDIYRYVYFFAPEEENISVNQVQDKEETNYIEISSINTLLTDFYNYQQCLTWNKNQLNILMRRFGNALYNMCTIRTSSSNEHSKCTVLNSLSGYINSPGYPLSYFGNQNLCYRFYFSPGYCTLNLVFNDFEVESSYDCQKDYLTIENNRYCGDYLKRKTVTISARGRPYQDITFTSDSNYCGKGFSAQYQQVSCHQSGQDVGCRPPTGGPDARTGANCGRVIRENTFVIGNIPRGRNCYYEVRKFSQDVCKIELYFEHFNLPCNFESFTINGRNYCGELTGRTIIVDALDYNVIVYQNYVNTLIQTSQFLVRGRQITEYCNPDLPPPVRVQTHRVSNSFSDICDSLKRASSSRDLPKQICDYLSKYHGAESCTFSKAAIIDRSPGSNATKILLSNQEQGGVTEIECTNL
ncbi:uncharacterized protein LOC115891521 [Sitophilus oryzae]|uniref:Uncharacterized protein LOC115891521 n=1 Tax=Sitophilus oryzae TaxID=7048 RepID=A0A6J2YYF9_SITOR|nr:uncharacterized protein LOC115891521 [Sitophilus oryzae]